MTAQDRKYIGIGAAFGIIGGAVVTAITGSPLGLALGVIVGAMAGSAFNYIKKQQR